jgi:hypothetical protein
MPLANIKHDKAPFPYRVNEPSPIRQKLGSGDWHNTNDVGRSLVLRSAGGKYKVSVGDEKRLVDLGMTVSGISYSFHPDGHHVALAAGTRGLIVDMRDGTVLSERKLDGEVGSIAFCRDGVILTCADELVHCALEGEWKERWRLPASGIEVLVGLKGRRMPMVWAIARPDGVVALCQQATPRRVKVVWFQKGRTAVCSDYSPNYETCYELVGAEEAVAEAAEASLTTDLDVTVLEKLPKIGRPKKKAAKKKAKKPLPEDLPTFTRATLALIEAKPKVTEGGYDASALLALDLPADLRAYVERIAPRVRDTTQTLDVFGRWDIRFGLEPLEKDGTVVAIGVGVTAGGEVLAVRLGDIEGNDMVEVYDSFERMLSEEAMRRGEPDPNLEGLVPDDLSG